MWNKLRGTYSFAWPCLCHPSLLHLNHGKYSRTSSSSLLVGRRLLNCCCMLKSSIYLDPSPFLIIIVQLLQILSSKQSFLICFRYIIGYSAPCLWLRTLALSLTVTIYGNQQETGTWRDDLRF